MQAPRSSGQCRLQAMSQTEVDADHLTWVRCGGKMHFEVSGECHIVQERSDAGALLGAFGIK